MSTGSHGKPDLEAYRGYLRVLADIQHDPRLRAKEDTSDVVQLTLMQAYRDLENYRGNCERELRAWLKAIMTHTLINLGKKYRRQKRDVRRERSIDQHLHESASRIIGDLPGDQSSPSQKLIRQERAEKLADAMSKLRREEYTAVLLKHVHGWKVGEIADHLGRSPEGVAGLLRRGLKKLRNAMQMSEGDR